VLHNQRILVTGAAGFIGSHVVDTLLAAGCSVVGIDNFDRADPRSVKHGNLRQALASNHFELVDGDICDQNVVAELFASATPFDAVIHLAARVGVRPSLQEPLAYEYTNVHGTLVLLEAAIAQKPSPRFVFGSSSSVYGNGLRLPLRESDPADTPISPYAATKRSGELLCRCYHEQFGLDVFCLRLFTVYGPRLRPDLAIYRFTQRVLAGDSIPMYGDGSSSRDYTFVGDVARAFTAAVAVCSGFEVINIGGEHPITLTEMIHLVGEACGRGVDVHQLPPQDGDVLHTYSESLKARQMLGFEPKTSFVDGLSQFVSWYRAQ